MGWCRRASVVEISRNLNRAANMGEFLRKVASAGLKLDLSQLVIMRV